MQSNGNGQGKRNGNGNGQERIPLNIEKQEPKQNGVFSKCSIL